MDSNSQAVSDAPRIAIPVPTTGDLDYNRRSWAAYAEAVRLAGGEPVEVPLSMAYSDLTELAAGCQGILLPGSPADVNPDRYGQERIAECAPADAAREAVDLALLEDAYQQRKPIFAICFGFQVLNAWRGGTLIQDLTVMPVNHVAGRSVAVAHSVMVAPESLLGEIVKEQEDGSKPEEAGPFEISEEDGFLRLPINSSHHQAVAIPGDGLRVSARCLEDGVIEAVEGAAPDHFVLGVQWHPERSYGISPASRRLFARFIGEARKWTPVVGE